MATELGLPHLLAQHPPDSQFLEFHSTPSRLDSIKIIKTAPIVNDRYGNIPESTQNRGIPPGIPLENEEWIGGVIHSNQF